MPWQARTVNVMKGGWLSELIKEDCDCLVTVLHKIFQHGRGREIGSVGDTSITLSNIDKIGELQNDKTLLIILRNKDKPWGSN